MPLTIKKLPPTTRTRKQAARTLWTASKLLEAYRDPREILLEIASTDTAVLAERMGCTLLEALQEKRLCAQAVLPYVAQKLPVQVDVDMRQTKAIHLNIVDQTQFAELQAIAAATDEATLQLITGVTATESVIEASAADGGETDVQRSVAPHFPGDATRASSGG
jgi:hypothetical protein